MAYQGGRSFMDIGQKFQANAIGARGAERQVRETPDKTVGGGIGASAGMAAAGGTLGSMMASAGTVGSAGGPWGAAIGAGVGLVAYLLS